MMTASLSHFAVELHGDRYCLRLTLDDGTVLAVPATFDQLDQLGEEIDRRLDADQEIPLPQDL
ncbi:hypothetical protein [Sphingobium sp. LMC3-1-1.1]|jgi:hypothetical protein|uniref:hypothetical protein n=1 Tax=Sphingobium sp. LMC3-1-1.1 TaxID=3135241 RepID=UPI0010619462